MAAPGLRSLDVMQVAFEQWWVLDAYSIIEFWGIYIYISYKLHKFLILISMEIMW